MVKQPSGRQVPVVQAYAFGKYLGNLHVTFNEDGEVVATSGHPILLDHSVAQGFHLTLFSVYILLICVYLFINAFFNMYDILLCWP